MLESLNNIKIKNPELSFDPVKINSAPAEGPSFSEILNSRINTPERDNSSHNSCENSVSASEYKVKSEKNNSKISENSCKHDSAETDKSDKNISVLNNKSEKNKNAEDNSPELIGESYKNAYFNNNIQPVISEKADLTDNEFKNKLKTISAEIHKILEDTSKNSNVKIPGEKSTQSGQELKKILLLVDESLDRNEPIKTSTMKRIMEQLEALIEKQKDKKTPEQIFSRKLSDLLHAVKQTVKKHDARHDTETAKVPGDRNNQHIKNFQDLKPQTMENPNSTTKDFSGKGHDSEGQQHSFQMFMNNNSIKNIAGKTPERSPLFQRHLNEIINQAKVVVKDSKNARFSVRLFPKSLGSLNVNLGLDQGIIVGKFMVESVDAKEALMAQLEDIRQQLEESGVSVGEFQVNVNSQRETNHENSEDKKKNLNNFNTTEITDKHILYDQADYGYAHEGFSMII